MFTLEGAVRMFLYLLLAAAVFGLMFAFVKYLERKFPGAAPFFFYVEIAVVVLAFLFAIFFLLSLAGVQVIKW